MHHSDPDFLPPFTKRVPVTITTTGHAPYTDVAYVSVDVPQTHPALLTCPDPGDADAPALTPDPAPPQSLAEAWLHLDDTLVRIARVGVSLEDARAAVMGFAWAVRAECVRLAAQAPTPPGGNPWYYPTEIAEALDALPLEPPA